MAKKLYVGNLSYDVRDKDLEEHFSQAGTVISANVVMDKMNPNHSRGFGFIEMEDADADKAIEMFNEKDFQGRTLKVNEAKPRE